MKKIPELFPLFQNLPKEWKALIKEELNEYNLQSFSELSNFVIDEYQKKNIYPPFSNIFYTFELPPERIKCVILGQDPYHGKNQANGLAFSVTKQTTIPPSLSNIFKELQADLGLPYPKHGDLSKWKDQGVLLLNTILTVEEKKPKSHENKGWETFTNLIIKSLANKYTNLVFILWGEKACNKTVFIDPEKHLIIKSTHPSPYAAFGGFNCKHQSFFNSKPFSRTNSFLKGVGLSEIDWAVE